MLEGNTRLLNKRDGSYIINRGGTILYTARCEKFKTEEGIKLGAGDTVYQTVGYKLQSDSLKVSVVTTDGKQNVQIDCVWGEFN